LPGALCRRLAGHDRLGALALGLRLGRLLGRLRQLGKTLAL
jgi:hypothetical protein